MATPNLAAVDLNLLVVFEALLIERNVSRAAGRVGLTQPSVSNALARLPGAVRRCVIHPHPAGNEAHASGTGVGGADSQCPSAGARCPRRRPRLSIH